MCDMNDSISSTDFQLQALALQDNSEVDYEPSATCIDCIIEEEEEDDDDEAEDQSKSTITKEESASTRHQKGIVISYKDVKTFKDNGYTSMDMKKEASKRKARRNKSKKMAIQPSEMLMEDGSLHQSWLGLSLNSDMEQASELELSLLSQDILLEESLVGMTAQELKAMKKLEMKHHRRRRHKKRGDKSTSLSASTSLLDSSSLSNGVDLSARVTREEGDDGKNISCTTARCA